MKKRTLFMSLFLLPLIFLSCEKDSLGLPKGTPDCIEKEIRNFISGRCSKAGKVSRFDTQAGHVYAFAEGECFEAGTIVYDENCKEVCLLSPMAGFDCNKDTLTLTFTNEVVLWQD